MIERELVRVLEAQHAALALLAATSAGTDAAVAKIDDAIEHARAELHTATTHLDLAAGAVPEG